MPPRLDAFVICGGFNGEETSSGVLMFRGAFGSYERAREL